VVGSGLDVLDVEEAAEGGPSNLQLVIALLRIRISFNTILKAFFQ
jgi:hypothetical protein